MEPRDTENRSRSAGSATIPRHRHWVAATLLIALTAGVGLAARLDAPNASPPVAPAENVVFGTGQSGPVDFSARLDRAAVMSGGDGVVMMELVLAGQAVEDAAALRTPTDLVIVLDRSGSMQGAPMQHAKASARQLMAGLGHDDRLALVSYSNGARVDIPLSWARGEAPVHWRTALDAIEVNGGTDMASGLDRANRIAVDSRAVGRGMRVILISDGHANQGDHSLSGLRARASKAVPGEFVLSSVGVGDGFDERLMTALADAGTGNFYYVRDAEKLASVFDDEFLSARETVARALTLEIEPGAGVSLLDAAGYPMAEEDGRWVVRPGSLFSGQERRLWLTLAVAPERMAEASGPVPLGDFALRFREVDETPHRVRLEGAPSVSVVANEADFYANADAEMVQRVISTERLGRLRQQVADLVQKGDKQEALRRIEGYERKNSALLSGLGVAASESPAMVEADRLRDDVEEALSPRARPGAANSLGKALASEGYDQRRAGAKRK